MNINKTNYESFFLDYYEGSLSAMQVAELFLFLQQNEGLRKEFDSFNQININPADETVFEAKESLKRSVITEHNIDYYLVSELENNLTLQDRIQLRDFLKRHPQLENDRTLYSQTKLQATAEIFPGKRSLKINTITPAYKKFSYWATAAVILLILGIIYINRPEDERRIAQQNNKTKQLPSDINDVNQHANNKLADKKVASTKTNDVIVSPQENKTPGNEPRLSHDFLAGNASEKTNVKRELLKQRDIKHIEKSIDERNNEDMLMAEMNATINIDYPMQEAFPVKRNTAEIAGNLASAASPRERNSMEEKFRDLKDVAAEKVNLTTGEEILYSSQKTETASVEKLPFKSRMIKLLAWTINSIGGEKVLMKTDFDLSGNLARYDISAGKFKFEKDF